jgi:cytochrome c oxidase subunit 2
VRRRFVAFSLLPVAALGFAGTALASNGGISPVGPESPNAARIEDAYWVVLILTGAVFVIVEAVLITFMIRFRRRGRPRNAEGPQIHGATKLEVIWTVIPVVILGVIVSFVFYKLPGIKDPPSASAGNQLNIRVEAHQFYWRFIYPDGRQSINVLRVPVGRVVTLDLTSADVIHSWWVPALGGKTDTIPGKTNHTWFQAEHVGAYPIRCAEFCGIQHAAMHGFVEVTPAGAAPSGAELGKQVVQGVCATCHGFRLEGLIGPAIANNPTLSDARALETLLRNGFGKMPPVGKTWDDQLMKATTDYLKAHYGANAGGTSGG